MALNVKQFYPQPDPIFEPRRHDPAPSSLTDDTPRSIRLRLLDVFLVTLIGLFFCLYRTGESSFSSGDQTTHASVVQEMNRTGELLHPRYNNKPYYNKPPFKMWLSVLPVRLLGETNFAYRVIDGLSGVGIGLCVFLFARSLFLSRLAAYVALSALFGARLFFFGHGVRNAVQDSMMLLLMSIGTICGWYFVESALRFGALDPDERRKRLKLVLIGGVSIGLAALTKNVAGYMSFIILAGYLALSRELITVVKRTWGQLLTIGAISVAIPAAYILAQGHYFRLAWQMLLVTEVFKRVTQGYHFVNHRWFYWNAIVPSRIVVPPELLALGLLYCAYVGLKKVDRRYLFLLSWALVPVLVQNSMASKLLWYILPALPGMALVVGVLVGDALLSIRAQIAEHFRKETGFRFRIAFQALLVLFSVGVLGYNNYAIAHDIFFLFRRNVTDELIEDIKAYSKVSGQKVQAVIFNSPTLAKHEVFYWNMVPHEEVADKNLDLLKQKIDSGEAQFVVASVADFDDVAKAHRFESYSLIPIHDKRRSWLAIFNYVPGFLPRHFNPSTKVMRFADEPAMLNNGFKSHGTIAGLRISPSRGSRSSVLLQRSLPYGILGTDVTLNLASTLPTIQGTVDVHVYLNEEKVATLTDVTEGFHRRTFRIPGGRWRSRTNLLTLTYELPDGGHIDPESQLILYESLEIALSHQ